MRLVRFVAMVLAASAVPAAHAAVVCTPSSVTPPLRSEGLTEQVGDIVLSCTGAPSERLAANLTVFLSVNVTNRIASDGALAGIAFSFNVGGGGVFQTVPNVRPILNGANAIAFSGIDLQLPATPGFLTLQISGVRAAVAQLGPNSTAPITATLAFSGPSSVSVPNATIIVGFPSRSLLVGSNAAVVTCTGSPLPDTIDFVNLLGARTRVSTIRVTEGFPDAFQKRTGDTTGTRFLVRYRGFPAGARLFVPDVIAGSTALEQTAGGDLNVPASGGRFQTSAAGSLLLARVQNTDPTGTLGTPVFTPGAPGSPAQSLNSIIEVPLTGGNGFVVYEVVDANPVVGENAHIPTFLGFPAFREAVTAAANVDVVLAPVSTATRATEGDPIPRFLDVPAAQDCQTLGDCSVFPRLETSNFNPISFTAQSGGPKQASFDGVINAGGGTLDWTATITYKTGSGWASLYTEPNRGRTPGMLRVIVDPTGLAPGTYEATVTVDAGFQGGSTTIPVTLVVTAAPPVVVIRPAVSAAVNAASFAAGPLAAGSIATIWAEHIVGKDLAVSFDGLPARVFYRDAKQINLLVPSELGLRQSAQVVVTVDGQASAPLMVQLAPMNPAIFQHGVLNQDSAVNSADAPAAAGSVLQIFATGLPSAEDGTIAARLGDREIGQLEWAGIAPGFVGLWQVNLRVPADMSTGTADLVLCGVSRSSVQRVCSPAYKVAVRK